MVEKLHSWPAADVFKNLIDTAVVVIEDEQQAENADNRVALVEILENILKADKSGKAPSDFPCALPVNFVPGPLKADNHPILFGLCYGGDDFTPE
jgi:hypothetical protein